MFNYDGSFFFSSRRRHTSWPRDWSPDVCSSDLQNSSAIGTDVNRPDFPPARLFEAQLGEYISDTVDAGLCCPDKSTNRARSIAVEDRKSTRLNSSHVANSYAVFCLKKKKNHRCMTLRGSS